MTTAYAEESTSDTAVIAVPQTPAKPVTFPVQTVGRRKEAIARVVLRMGSGTIVVNGKPLAEYFPGKVQQQEVLAPLNLVGKLEAFDVVARIHGGGVTGQAGALRLAITRAIQLVDMSDRPALKGAGFLTRDARVKESKKYGLKKARKAPQYSKR